MSRFAPSGAGILPSIAAIEPRARLGGQIAAHGRQPSQWLAIATACLFVHGCDTVEGGAVELSWKLRPASSDNPEKFVDCRSGLEGTGRVVKMRLEWSVQTSQNDPIVTGSDTWPCDDSHGVTGFDLPAGTALLSVKPVCIDPLEMTEFDALAGSYIAPAAEQRRVSLGDTISLGAVELVVVVSDCDRQFCICE